MRKKSKKLFPIKRKSLSYTAEELEKMAWSLVNRGLASKGIIEAGFTKPPFNRGSRNGDHSAYERNSK